MNGVAEVAERAFFREEFRQRTLVLALRGAPLAAAMPVVRELVVGGSRVIVVASSVTSGSPEWPDTSTGGATQPVPPPAGRGELARLWTSLEDTGLQVVSVDDDPASVAATIAADLAVSKLVLTDPAGGWGGSFASLEDLEDDAIGRPTLAAAIRHALHSGVDGVNVCRVEDLDTELFTFDGAGTLFTADSYIQVVRLGADDLPVVEQLVERGVAEGFLRPRSREEVVRLALGGLGARVGPNRHLAGFGALEVERYVPSGVGEVTCLYTVNRYAGEGVGGRLVRGLLQDARTRGLRSVFACTVSDRAASLFERSGFTMVVPEALPETKWIGYDPERRRRVAAHWIDLEPLTDEQAQEAM